MISLASRISINRYGGSQIFENANQRDHNLARFTGVHLGRIILSVCKFSAFFYTARVNRALSKFDRHVHLCPDRRRDAFATRRRFAPKASIAVLSRLTKNGLAFVPTQDVSRSAGSERNDTITACAQGDQGIP